MTDMNVSKLMSSRPSILLGNHGEDEEESKAISNFVVEGCGCNKKNGEPCSKLFSQHELKLFVAVCLNYLAMSWI